MDWHKKDINKIFEMTGTSEQGLSAESVIQKQSEFGKNRLDDVRKKSVWLMFLNQFRDFMIIVLIAAAVVSGIIGDLTDTIIILVIVILNAILGFVQEYRAEKALEALKKMAALNASVIRDGKVQSVDAEELVPGDVIVLETGNIVPADIRLIETFSLKADESSLTGESVSVNKNSDVINEAEVSLGDRFNMLYKTTLITAGRAKGVVVSTGMNTEIGKIAKMLDVEESATPLQIRMNDFGKKLSYLIFLICILLFVIGLLRGEDPVNMLLLSISLAVAAIPEALPALITIALAAGAKRMVKVNVLIRKLYAVETLGSVNFICSDKTGTLTLNKMTVVEVEENKDIKGELSGLSILELSMALNNDVNINKEQILIGDPTEIALVEYVKSQHAGLLITDLRNEYKRLAEIPFDSNRKCMTTVHKLKDKYLIITKGAAEVIAEKFYSGINKEFVLSKTEELAGKGIRVIAFGYKILSELSEPPDSDIIESNITFSGLAGMIDPPRPEVKSAIQECKTAGIKTVMITGDHAATASSIAKEIGILQENNLSVTGKELQNMTEYEFTDKVENIRVYARVSPEQKLSIVKALQKKNNFVAMTGDGVNDAPSLKSSNIGIAMGINGTDVSKEASHMILLDDNFVTIVRAVKEGRRIYDNIRKFVKYIMTCNSAEIMIIFLAPFFGLPIPLIPIHLLWINLVTDGLPGLALASENEEPDVMSRPPRSTNESLFSDGIGYHIVWVGMLMAGVTLALQAWAFHTGNPDWQTMVFTVLALSQIGHVMAIRSDYELLYKRGIFSNLPLFGAALLTLVLQLMVIYLPAANKVFKTNPLSMTDLVICLLLSTVVFHAVELEKYIKKKIRIKKNSS
ncbi:MAG: calcium-translocating P-type ATPase, PMCA-type [Ignavibacteriae bacterium]|nr:calcium-translocating P-type ATPase, PMCA-type [Ignavibacteriota bacterium]